MRLNQLSLLATGFENFLHTNMSDSCRQQGNQKSTLIDKGLKKVEIHRQRCLSIGSKNQFQEVAG
tara:strand:+ start:1780 stop:1974 length:195 start_codon:yes stop_codon:yes gene_type:complete